MAIVHVVDTLDLEALPPGTMQRYRVDMVRDGMGEMIRLPVIVARGTKPGPVVGFTAAVHGNELNGVRAVQRLVAALDPAEMSGTVVAVPVVNVPGYLSNRREFNDNTDLNRVMPGNPRVVHLRRTKVALPTVCTIRALAEEGDAARAGRVIDAGGASAVVCLTHSIAMAAGTCRWAERVAKRSGIRCRSPAQSPPIVRA